MANDPLFGSNIFPVEDYRPLFAQGGGSASNLPSLTAKQLMELQAQQQQTAWMGQLTQNINAMLADPAWQNASVERKEEMVQDWTSRVFQPWAATTFAGQDEARDLARQLSVDRLNEALKMERKKIGGVSQQAGDLATQAEHGLENLAATTTGALPLAARSAGAQFLEDQTARQEASLAEALAAAGRQAMTPPRPESLGDVPGMAIDYLSGGGPLAPLINMGREAVLQGAAHLGLASTPGDIQRRESQLAAERLAVAAEARARQEAQARERAENPLGQNRMRYTQERREAGDWIPYTAGGFLAEGAKQIGQMGPALAATIGTAALTRNPALTQAVAAAGVGSQIVGFDTENAVQTVMNAPDDQVRTWDRFKQMAAENPNVTPMEVRQAVLRDALPQVAEDAAKLAVVSSLIGPEAVLGRNIAARGGARGIGARIKRTGGRALLGLGTEAGEEGREEQLVNQAIATAGGPPDPGFTRDMAEQMILGGFFGFGAGSANIFVAPAAEVPAKGRFTNWLYNTQDGQFWMNEYDTTVVPGDAASVQRWKELALDAFNKTQDNNLSKAQISDIQGFDPDNPAGSLTWGAEDMRAQARGLIRTYERVIPEAEQKQLLDTFLKSIGNKEITTTQARSLMGQLGKSLQDMGIRRASLGTISFDPDLDIYAEETAAPDVTTGPTLGAEMETDSLSESLSAALAQANAEARRMPRSSLSTRAGDRATGLGAFSSEETPSVPPVQRRPDGAYYYEGTPEATTFRRRSDGDWDILRNGASQTFTLGQLRGVRPDVEIIFADLEQAYLQDNPAPEPITALAQPERGFQQQGMPETSILTDIRNWTREMNTPLLPMDREAAWRRETGQQFTAAQERAAAARQDAERLDLIASYNQLQNNLAKGEARYRQLSPEYQRSAAGQTFRRSLDQAYDTLLTLRRQLESAPFDQAPEPGPAPVTPTPASPEFWTDLNTARLDQSPAEDWVLRQPERVQAALDAIIQDPDKTSPIDDAEFAAEADKLRLPQWSQETIRRMYEQIAGYLGISPRNVQRLLQSQQVTFLPAGMDGAYRSDIFLLMVQPGENTDYSYILPHEFNHAWLTALLQATDADATALLQRLAQIMDIRGDVRNLTNWQASNLPYLSRPIERLAFQFQLYLQEKYGQALPPGDQRLVRGMTVLPELRTLWEELYGPANRETTVPVPPLQQPADTGSGSPGGVGENVGGAESQTGQPGPTTSAAPIPPGEFSEAALTGEQNENREGTGGTGAETGGAVEAAAPAPEQATGPVDVEETPAAGGATESPGVGGEAPPGAGAAQGDATPDQPLVRTRRRAARRNQPDARTGGEPAAGGGVPGPAEGTGASLQGPEADAGQSAAGDDSTLTPNAEEDQAAAEAAQADTPPVPVPNVVIPPDSVAASRSALLGLLGMEDVHSDARMDQINARSGDRVLEARYNYVPEAAARAVEDHFNLDIWSQVWENYRTAQAENTDPVWQSYLNRRTESVLLDAVYDPADPFRKSLSPEQLSRLTEDAAALRARSIGVAENTVTPFALNGKPVPDRMSYGKTLRGATAEDLGRWLVEQGFLNKGASIIYHRGQGQGYIVRKGTKGAVQVQPLPPEIHYLPSRKYLDRLAIGDQMARTVIQGSDGRQLNLRSGKVDPGGVFIPKEVMAWEAGVESDTTGAQTQAQREYQQALQEANQVEQAYRAHLETVRVRTEESEISDAERNRLSAEGAALREEWQDKVAQAEAFAEALEEDAGEIETRPLLMTNGKSDFNGKLFIFDTENNAAREAEFVLYKKNSDTDPVTADKDGEDIGVDENLRAAAAAFLQEEEQPTDVDLGLQEGNDPQPAARETAGDAEAETIENSWDTLTAEINRILNESPAATAAPAATTGPVPTGAQLAAQLQAARLEPGTNTGRFAPTAYGEVADAVGQNRWWQGLGRWLRRSLEDHQADFREHLAALANVKTGSREDIPVLKALTLMPAEIRKAKERMFESLGRPVINYINRLAEQKGISAKEVYSALNTAATVRHVLDEAAAWQRKLLGEELDAAQALPDDDPTKRRQVLQAEAAIKAYDHQQATNEPYLPTPEEAEALNVPPNKTIRARLAGGLTNQERQAQWDQLRQVFTEEELREGTKLIVDGFQGFLPERIQARTLLPEEVENWAGFTQYVPLATKAQVNTLTGDYPANWILNPSRTEYRRQGSTTPALGALDLFWKMLDRTASEIGSVTFKRELDQFYEDRIDTLQNQTGEVQYAVGGLMKIPLDYIEGNLSGADRGQVMQARRWHEKPGFILHKKIKEGDGPIRTKSFKFIIADGEQGTVEAERLAAIEKSMAAAQQAGVVVETAAKATRAYGLLVTKYNPIFPPINGFKDFLERTQNAFTRTFRTAGGELLSGANVAARMARLVVNPQFMGDFFKGFWGRGNTDTHFGRLWKEFNDSGANYNFTNALRLLRDAKTGQEYLADMNNWRKWAKRLDTPFAKINDMFNALPAFIQYAALREEGASARDSAAYTLDLFNMYKQGQVAPYAQAIMPFFRPSIQGGANLIRSLREGKVRGVAALVGQMMVYGLIVQALRGLAGDDEETGINRYDALSPGDISRGLSIFTEDGGRFIIPVGFGLQQVAWVVANAGDRLARGIDTPGDAAFSIFASGTKNIVPGNMPGYQPMENPVSWLFQTFIPSPIAPVLEVNLLNKNYWGSEINYGSRAVGERDFEAGRNTTNLVWHKWAKLIHDTVGADFTPETVRHYANYYMAGPFRGIAAWMESDPINQPMHESTRSALGPVLSAIGASSIYSTQMNVAQSQYFKLKNQIEAELTAKGVRTTSPDNTGRNAAEKKAAMIRRGMREAGFDDETQNLYLALVRTESALRKRDTEFNKKYKQFRFNADYEDQLRRAYQDWSKDRQKLLEDVIREYELRR